MDGARMHLTVSGCGDVLVQSEEEAIAFARHYLSYFPPNFRQRPQKVQPKDVLPSKPSVVDQIPENQNAPFNMYDFIDCLIDADSFCEIKKTFAPEIITGLARIDGGSVGIIANQPKTKGGVLFPDSADKAAKFIQLCDAFNIAVRLLGDIPRAKSGKKVERDGVIRNGANVLTAMSEETMPKISAVVRTVYGEGLSARAGSAFEADACSALPTAQIAAIGT